VPVDVEQHVVGFEVPVDVLHLVDRIQGQQYFCGVELGLFVGEDVLFHEEVHEVSAGQVLHDEVEIVVVLEGTLESDHPRVLVGVGEDVSFFA